MENQSIELWIEKLEYGDRAVRESAIKALVQIGAPAVEPLLSSLKSVASYVRREAALALGQIGDARAVEPLIARLNDHDVEVREAAVEALSKIGGERAVAALFMFSLSVLIEKLADESSTVRESAIKALVQIGAPAVEPMIEALRFERYPVNVRLIRALSQIGDARAVEPLIKWLEHGGYRDTTPRDEEPLTWREEYDHGYYDSPHYYPSPDLPLTDEEISAAIFALGRIGDASAVETIVKYGTKVDVVITALMSIGASAVEPLIKIMNRKGINVHASVVIALGKIGDRRAVEPLITLMEKAMRRPSYIAEHAAEALTRIGDGRAVEPLIEWMNNSSSYHAHLVPSLQKSASQVPIVALGQIGDARAVEPLIAQLKNARSRETALVIAEALGKIGGERVVAPLLTHLAPIAKYRHRIAYPHDSASDINQINDHLDRLVLYLAKIGNPAVNHLVAALNSRDEDVRSFVAKALVKMGVPAAEPLVAALEDKKKRVRKSAVQILEEIASGHDLDKPTHELINRALTTARQRDELGWLKFLFR